MATTPTSLMHRFLRAGSAALLLAAANCAPAPPPTASVAMSPIPAGAARVWFYRDAGPYDAQDRPLIRMNEQVVGILEPQGAFYRDIPPGHYHVSVDQYGSDFNVTSDVDLAGGQQIYFKIVSLSNWLGGGGNRGGSAGYERPTFYVWVIPPDAARSEVARTPFTSGG